MVSLTVKGAEAVKPSPSVLEDLNLDDGLNDTQFDPTLYRQQFCAKLAKFLSSAARGRVGEQGGELRVATLKTAAASWMPSVEMPLLNHSVAPTNGATGSLGLRPSGHRTWVDTHPRPHVRGAGEYGGTALGGTGPTVHSAWTAALLAAYNRTSASERRVRQGRRKAGFGVAGERAGACIGATVQRRKSPGLWLYAVRVVRY
jgi:hypothetical protein